MAANQKRTYSVQVRELVEFVLRKGNLGGNREFLGRGRALAGTRGHQKIQKSRPADYQKEVPVDYGIERERFILRIRGRIDGLTTGTGVTLLEEIKTVQGAWDRTPNPLHLAQAKLYAAIHARAHELQNLDIVLTYLELESETITDFRYSCTRHELDDFFDRTTSVYLEWISAIDDWRHTRDESIKTLDFPFGKYRPGQRTLAVAAYRALAKGQRLFVEAPTGIGKTMSVCFPAVKALAANEVSQIFYLTARTPGRAIAEKAFEDMRSSGLRIRSVTLTAREKVCVRDGHPCQMQECPLALGYFDRYQEAMKEGFQREKLTRSVLEALAQKHQVCPFELSLDISSWVDAVICDYNYVFDPKVYLKRHFADGGGEVALLVDEAHNLPDRAREMFSAELDTAEVQLVRKAIKKAIPRCSRALDKLVKLIRKLATNESPDPEDPPEAITDLFAARQRETPPAKTSPSRGADVPLARVHKTLPEGLLEVVEQAVESAEAWLARNEETDFREDLLQLYFQLHSFLRTGELYDENYTTLVEQAKSLRVRLFCLDPSRLLAEALERGKGAIMFSATLTPLPFFRAVLGGKPDDPILRLASPFPPQNQAVLIQDRIATNWKSRDETIDQVTSAIETLVSGKTGNYLIYLPSYQYLTRVRDRFQALHPEIPVITQAPGMTEQEREAFVEAFRTEQAGTLAGFAVLGGIFSEGIDLVGEHLIGAAIVGVGLPQLCLERDLIKQHFQASTGSGFEYAYTFPGMNRVLQAVGRVIRSETDRGVILLIDARYGERRYQSLLPEWWSTTRITNETEVASLVHAFWHPETTQGPTR